MEHPNINYINDLAGDDTDFKDKLILIIKTELPEEIKSYNTLMEAKNYKLTAALVHKIKHKVSILGLVEGYRVSEQFEMSLKNGVPVLQKDFEEILSVMINYVTNL